MTPSVGTETRSKVLVVSDDGETLSAVEQSLAARGQVLSSKSATEAVALLRRETVDAVIAEDTATASTGTELFATLMLEVPEPARILISAGRQVEPIIEAVNRSWVFHCLDSAWQPDELRAALDAALRRGIPARSRADAASPAVEERSDTRLRVLFIDDEPINLTISQVAFDERFTVHAASSAAMAREILATHPIDVVVADLHMPETNGIDLMVELVDRQHPAARILLTGAFSRRAVRDAVNRGRVHGLATKPWTPEGLDALIRTARQRSLSAAPRAVDPQRSTQ